MLNTARCFYLCSREISKEEIISKGISIKEFNKVLAYRVSQNTREGSINKDSIFLNIYSNYLYRILFNTDANRLLFLDKFKSEQLTLPKLEGVVASSSIWFYVDDIDDKEGAGLNKIAISKLIANYESDIKLYGQRINRTLSKIDYLRKML